MSYTTSQSDKLAAKLLKSSGYSNVAIAKRLEVSETTVRRWLAS